MNPNTHFYLYAKWHYQEGNLIDDLKQILSKRSAIDTQYIQTRDLAQILLGLAWKHISTSGNPEYQFIEFVSRLHQADMWGNPMPEEERKDFYDVLLANCLSVLRNTKVAGLDLGEVDPSILPLKAPANKAMNSEQNRCQQLSIIERLSRRFYRVMAGVSRLRGIRNV